MDVYRLYQGYPSHKNQFFAPSIAKRTKTPDLHSKTKCIIISKNFLKQLITPASKRRQKSNLTSTENDLITPETLSYHINRTSLSNTPVPKKNKTAYTSPYYGNSSRGSPTTIERSVLLVRHQPFKKSCDVAIQNVSSESIHFPEIFYNPRF